MPTSAGTLLTQIAALDARISNTDTVGFTNMQDGSSSAGQESILKLIEARNILQAQYDRLVGGGRSLFRRGRVVGLPGGPVSQADQ